MRAMQSGSLHQNRGRVSIDSCATSIKFQTKVAWFRKYVTAIKTTRDVRKLISNSPQRGFYFEVARLGFVGTIINQ